MLTNETWEIDGETVETVSDFIFLGSKITADGDCSHEIKRCLLLGRKVMTNLDSILKSRHITLPKKVHLVKAMVFPVVMYGCESWTLKKAKCWKIDAFELWCWRRLFRVPWTGRRSNQSTLKEISPGCSLEGLMLKWNSSTLATSCEELIHWKRPWCWEGLGAGGEGDDRGWDGWMASPSRWAWVWVNSGSWWWTGKPGMLRFMGSQRVGHDWVTELNWLKLPGADCWPSRGGREVNHNKFNCQWFNQPYLCDEVSVNSKAEGSVSFQVGEHARFQESSAGEHGSPMPIPFSLASAILPSDCSWVKSFYNKPVI